MADSKRQLQFSRLIRKDLTHIFSKDYHLGVRNTILTISYVKMSIDLSIANIYVSIYPPIEKENIMKKIIDNGSEIRYQLGKRIGKRARIVPKLNFFYDDLMNESDKVQQMLNDIK